MGKNNLLFFNSLFYFFKEGVFELIFFWKNTLNSTDFLLDLKRCNLE